ncbi:tyrosine-protein phosphatase [Maribacter sp. CXY002]|uniref:tyrosine-protein phosphatase n=1 Tax=Maribacter luteocoastalis TaxID=3407671 RepID=UPI003B66FADE
MADHLNGFIDIHNHILPGIDDGSPDVETSLNLLRGFSEFGTTSFICTPHIMENYYPNTISSIHSSLTILNNALKINDMGNISIKAAAEHMIDANFEDLLALNQTMPLNKDHLLVEMSYLQASINFESAINKAKNKQYFVVLAHPERYVYLHSNFKNYENFKKMGIRFQLNILSVGGYYGKKIQKIALKLLEEGLFDFVGTDVHNMKHLSYLKNHIALDNKTINKIINLIINTNETFEQS